MPALLSSITSLAGARRLNNMLGLVAYEDPGGKLAIALSAINALVSNLTIIQSALVSANVSAVTFSALSGVTFATYPAAISNFSST